MALLIGAPISLLTEWQATLDEYGLNRVAVGGGWERFELENMVPFESPEARECDAVYVGDVITRDTVCPLCGDLVYDVISGWSSSGS